MPSAPNHSSSSPGPTPLPGQLAELWDLVTRYVKQETVGPLRGLGRTIGRGLAAALLVGFGTVMVLLAALRALQSETGDTFDGNFSFVPYLIVVIGCVAVVAGAAALAGRKGDPRD